MTPKSRGFASNYRIVLLAAGLFCCFAGIGVRLVYLHVVDREAWLSTIVKVRRQMIVEKAKRGDILDRNGAILATSRPLVVVGVDPSVLVETEQEMQKWPELARLLGMPEAKLRQIFTTKFRDVAPATPASAPATPVADRPAASAAATSPSLVFNLSGASAAAASATAAGEQKVDEEVADLDDAPDASGRREIRWVKLAEGISEATFDEIEKLKIRGVYAPPRSYRRVYPNKQLAAHLIGYVDREGRPATGIEYYTDFYLRGQNGWRVGERDGRNRELAQFRTREVPRADGYSVKLSIDSAVQDLIEQELNHIAQEFRPLKATIIVSDPRTGFIHGLGNYPSFDLNEYNKVPADEMARMKNVAVADIYEPGSVFKIVSAAGVLEEGLVDQTMRFDCALEDIVYRGDKDRYHGKLLDLPAEDHRMGHYTIAEVIAHSSNKGAAQFGMLLGESRLYRYAQAFGFGRTLGFPVGGEQPGMFRQPEKWDLGDITRIPMGHTIAATVLQMHQAMTVIANDGVLLRPQIIQEIRDASGEVVFTYDKVELGRAVSAETARAVGSMLMGVVSRQGTANEAAIEGFDVAGKTGTSQKLVPVTLADGRTKLVYSNRQHIASFVGFFPAGRPQVAISVIVDEAHPPGGGNAYGRVVAAPSFKRLGEKLIPILDIKPAHRTARLPLIAAHEGGRR